MELTKAPAVQYKEATLHIPNQVNATWFVFWYNLNPATGKLERVKKTCNLNRVADIAARTKKGNDCCAIINNHLRNGWNYFATEAVVKRQTEQAVAEVERNSLISVLESALKIRQLGMKERTKGSYKSFITVFIDWLLNNNYQHISVSEMGKELFMAFLFDRSEQGYGNRNLNDFTNFYKTTFDVVIKELKVITTNPVANVDFLPKHGSSLFQPLTSSEIRTIVPVLLEKNPRFYLFTKFIPHEFIRPHHIARLKARDIDYERSVIMLNDETTKNNKATQKQLLPGMRKLLIDMGYHKLPGNYYLFANKKFEPGPKLYSSLSIRAAEYWKDTVIDGLGIDKKMYALKHTSSIYMVEENERFDMKFLQLHMEHQSMEQTEIYLQGKVTKKMPKRTKILNY